MAKEELQTPDATQEDHQTNSATKELQICSLNDLQESCKKHTKLLLISAKKEREEFIRKFVDEAVPKDTEVVAYEIGGSCETLEKLGMRDACKAILIEQGKIRNETVLRNDDVKDTIALMKMMSEKQMPSECDSCKGEITVDGKGWRLKPESTSQCERELANLHKLGPNSRKYLEKHIKSELAMRTVETDLN